MFWTSEILPWRIKAKHVLPFRTRKLSVTGSRVSKNWSKYGLLVSLSSIWQKHDKGSLQTRGSICCKTCLDEKRQAHTLCNSHVSFRNFSSTSRYSTRPVIGRLHHLLMTLSSESTLRTAQSTELLDVLRSMLSQGTHLWQGSDDFSSTTSSTVCAVCCGGGARPGCWLWRSEGSSWEILCSLSLSTRFAFATSLAVLFWALGETGVRANLHSSTILCWMFSRMWRSGGCQSSWAFLVSSCGK